MTSDPIEKVNEMKAIAATSGGPAQMTAVNAALLRKPFPPAALGKLPKGGQMMDYCGHAAVTDRLLQVDPSWTWEPVAFDTNGLPAVTTVGKESVLWIRLTVCGVTRYGAGTCAPGAFELVKQLISDAIRNAAMRFGVALDLWSKEELHAPIPDGPTFDVEEIKRRLSVLSDVKKVEAKERFGWPPSDVPALIAWLTTNEQEPF